jgi:ferredoxin
MTHYRVHVDRDACCGHGRRLDFAPDLFESDDEGHSIVRFQAIDDHVLPLADRAAWSCPERAITVTRLIGGSER